MSESPQRYLRRMAIFLGFIVVGALALGTQLADLFLANPVFNSMIIAGLLLGVVFDITRVHRLKHETEYLQNLREELDGDTIHRETRETRGADEAETKTPPVRLLGPVAQLLRERRGRTLSAISMRTVQESIRVRVHESHETSRYLIGLLIFLGLLGTFWGLAEATAAVSLIIADLPVDAGDPITLFGTLREGLRTPLAGMGTAFSTSLFGLSGSLILGFLELQSAQAHNRFLEELEEWLTGMTRLSSASPGGDGEGAGMPAYVQALLEQTAESLDRLQRTITQGESERQQTERSLARLTDRLADVSDQVKREEDYGRKLYETQAAMRSLLERAAESGFGSGGGGGGLDAASREHLRRLDTTLEQVVQILAEGQEATVRTIRDELRLFARSLGAAIAEARPAADKTPKA